ncbi:L,D-transpeptidase family protein [Cognatiluteimonas weifangensis]|uniref:L,D-transpeptidase n=1 Tax=Cognatiluteimonas weifangensis TaxID=2303539 RepID=A0A372DPW7_9GAMM|nr:L,D-transpeptidase family protein [Luteimonas weifangensis]RFP61630.1 L,D-transpeptidase [Luteimonas weifangensis]
MGLARLVPVARARRWLARVLLLVAALPAVAAEPVLAPGEFVWMPQLAPSGPVVVVVSLPEQRAHVYRNGVRIGVSTVSTGMPGHETPTGVFTILEKRREHYSNLYDNAPMPFMQRLTWDGIALHAGKLPGYPASHGCVRLPYKFSELLFATTARGMTVVIADAVSHAPSVTYPGWFAPVAPGTGQPRPAPAVGIAGYRWQPELAPDGPLTVVLSLRDGALAVLRQGVEIGRAPVRWQGPAFTGTRAWVLLDGNGSGASTLAPGRPARRWMEATAAAPDAGADALVAAVRDGRLQLAPAFAAALYDALAPGATLVVTGEALGPQVAAQVDAAADRTVLEAEPAPPVQPAGD